MSHPFGWRNMFVKDFMTKDTIVVPPTASLPDTAELMKKHSLKRLPVTEKDRLIGLVTEKDVAKALPSSATSLSKHEINYLADKIKVADVMTKNVITTTADTTIEEAVMLMRHHDVGCLPVVENGKLQGIITESNVFTALTEQMGLNRAGLRVTVEVVDRIGLIADITTLIKELNLTVISLSTFPASHRNATIILRIATDDAQPVIKRLEANNYKIKHWTILN